MLVRKGIYIDEKYWAILELIKNSMKSKNNKISISQIITEAVKEKIEFEKENNLSVKMALCSSGYMDSEEEEEILSDLSNMSADDLKIDEVIQL